MTAALPLDVTIEMFYDSVWNDITPDVRQTQNIKMKWGRADEAVQASPNTLNLLLNNGLSNVNTSVSGRYSLRNPRSDLYGKLSRNTPIRVRLGDPDVSAMLLPGHEDGYATTPDHSSLDIVGDIDIRIDVTPDTWRPADMVGLARKYITTDNQRSWYFALLEDGTIRFAWSPDGTLASRIVVTSTEAVPSDTEGLTLRVTLDADNATGGYTVDFYTASTLDGPWTQLGDREFTTTTGATSIHAGTAALEVGRIQAAGLIGIASQAFQGEIRGFRVYGSTGILRGNPDFTALAAGTGGEGISFVDSPGRTWTLGWLAYVDDLAIQMVGEIAKMPPEWDVSGKNVWVPVEAKSITRRLGQGKSALRSPLYRDFSTASNMVAYWSCEDGRDATQVASAFGHAPLKVTGAVTMAADAGFAGSAPLPTFGTLGHIAGPAPAYVPDARQRVACMLHQSPDQATDRNLLFLTCAGGTIGDVTLVLKADGSLRLVMRTLEGASVLDFSGGVGDLRDEYAIVWVLLTQVGANIDWQFGRAAEGETAVTIQSGTLSSHSYGRYTSINAGSDGDLSGAGVGHLQIVNGGDDLGFWNTIFTSLVGWQGETAGDRIARLSREEGAPLTIVGLPGDTARMGKQKIDTYLNLTKACAETDLGILDDHQRLRARRYLTRTYRYNRTDAYVMDYAAKEVSPTLRPVPDDQATRNDVTVTRDGGSSFRAVQETGPLNVQDPTADPDGVGRYDSEKTLSLYQDGQVRHQAGWRLHLGTVDEDRYPSIVTNLVNTPDLATAARLLAPGSRVQITNPPDWLPPETIDQVAQGGEVTLSPYKHTISLTCTPASPWQVATVGSKVDTGGSEVASSFVAGTDTSMSVTVTGDKLWTTDAAQYPLEVKVAGVVLEVTAVSGTSSPQTFTVTATPVNGITKTIAAGETIRLAGITPVTAL